MRRILFQVHRWVGLIAGVYVVLISITGAALVFRIDRQRVSHPHLFTAGAGPLADPVTIMESVARGYPDQRLSGVDAPTTSRPTYLAYVTSAGGFKTVLVDPVTARVLGELPENTAVRTLQDLHYDLLSGRAGRVLNGIGAVAILLLGVSGVVYWWRRGWTWQRGHVVRDLHRAIGISSVAFILMWAITGVYFAFPSSVRAIVGRVSPLTVNRTPLSTPRSGLAEPSAREVIATARRHHAGHVARVVLPFGERGSWLVMFSERQPTPAYTSLDSVFVDRYTGEVIPINEQPASLGDRVTRAMTPLHVGSFGGTPLRMAWFVFGLAPSILAITGAAAWWRGGRR